jgi:hypothetical protein
MSVVHQEVEDGIYPSRIKDALVPLGYRDLGGDKSGGMSKTIIEDFKNILCILNRNSIQSSRTSRLQLARERSMFVRNPSLRTSESVRSIREVAW